MSVLEQFCRLAARLCDSPAAAIVGVAEPAGRGGAASWGVSDEASEVVTRLCRAAAALEDAADVAVGGEDAPVRACAAAAMRGRGGARLGTLCLFDTRARAFTPAEFGVLSEVARLVAANLELEAETLETQARLSAINAASPSAIIFTRRDGTIDACNDATLRLLGWSKERLVGKAYALAPPDGVEEMERRRRLNLAGETFHGFEARRLADDGRALDVSISAAPVRNRDGDISGTVVVMDDLTERKRLREGEQRRLQGLELAANDAPLSRIFEHLVESVELSIPEGICTILLCKGNALEHVASGPALPPIWIEAIGQARIGPSEGSCGTAAYFGKTIVVEDIATDPRWETPRPLALALGLRACWSAPIRNAQGVVHGTLAVYSGRTRVPTDDQLRAMHDAANLASIAIEGSRARERLEKLASCDALTGLPNRALFEDRLREAIDAAKGTGAKVFVGLLDLDRFKVINDSFGHVFGDQLLVEVASRLRRATRHGDTIARMGGDEFLFLLTGIENQVCAEKTARRILGELGCSFSLSGTELFVQASLGFSVYPDDATEPAQLLLRADRAMYEVKAQRTGVGFYQRHALTTPPELPLEAALDRALEKHEFVVQYQPRIDRQNRVCAAEAHLHWNHPELGLLASDRFIAVADEAGLAVPIETWMLKEACRFASRWKAAGGCGCVAVNVSARQCRERDFVGTVVDAIREAGIVPAQLWLQISETLIGRPWEGLAATLAELRSYGMRTMLDHFGTGFASLHLLRRLPLDGVKIDRSFLDETNAADQSGGRAILDAVVALSAALHLQVAAEGVETPSHVALALDGGCSFAQGLAIAPALPEDALLGWSPPAPAPRSGPGRRPEPDAEREAISRLHVSHERTKLAISQRE